jgi:predicted nucleic acid-binding protein
MALTTKKETTLKGIIDRYQMGLYTPQELLTLIRELVADTVESANDLQCYINESGGYHYAIQGTDVFKIQFSATITKLD